MRKSKLSAAQIMKTIKGAEKAAEPLRSSAVNPGC